MTRTWLVAALAVLAAPLAAQERGYDIDSIGIRRVYPAPAMRAVWDAVVACAGPQTRPTGRYEDIVWVAGNLRERDPRHEVIGAWIRPDTIALDTAVLGWPTDARLPIAAHEMLHHYLRPAPGTPWHPEVPFFQSCQLMPEQFLSTAPGYVSPWWGWDRRGSP